MGLPLGRPVLEQVFGSLFCQHGTGLWPKAVWANRKIKRAKPENELDYKPQVAGQERKTCCGTSCKCEGEGDGRFANEQLLQQEAWCRKLAPCS
jgi:hypothetical protein